MYRIIIADDEKDERNVIRFLLNKFNFVLHIDEVANGKEALSKLQETPTDILFTDVKMPFMDGIELATKARELYPNIQIIFFSGYDDFDYAKKAISLRAFDYILKPVNPMEFQKTLSSVLESIKNLTKEQEQSVSKNIHNTNEIPKIYDEIEQESSKHSIQIVQQYIHEHYHEDLSLNLLAEKVFLTPRYLSEIFIQETGCGINKYTKNLRMENAKHLLINTNMKISDIGKSVGYSNESYFCRSFRENFGLSPEKYRQIHT